MDRLEEHGVQRSHQPAHRIDDELQRVARRHAERPQGRGGWLLGALVAVLVGLHELVPMALYAHRHGWRETAALFTVTILVAVAFFLWQRCRRPR